MKVVTTGWPFLDIDGFAGCIAYAELLQTQGHTAQAISTAPMNSSISHTIQSWNAPLQIVYRPNPADTFSLIDISDPEYFDKFVDPARVETVIDHHVGFEQYWQDRLGDAAHIEFIGAACTQVYEIWQDTGFFGSLSSLSAKLLVCGILDNTLNLGAQVTTDRDKTAYAKLLEQAELPENWPAQYFGECEETILRDVGIAVSNDVKTPRFQTFKLGGETICFGQLAVWDAQALLKQHQATLQDAMSKLSTLWFVNLISIGEGRSYFLTSDPSVQAWLSKLLGVQFTGVVAEADRLWLRKEVIKHDAEVAR